MVALKGIVTMQRTLPEIAREGWSIQVYSGDRRLVCSLEPSHAWVFLAGLGMGFLLALIGLGNWQPQVTASERSTDAVTAPLSVD